MKIIIKTDETNLTNIHFKLGNKQVGWSDMTREEQITIVNALIEFSQLFQKFIKSE